MSARSLYRALPVLIVALWVSPDAHAEWMGDLDRNGRVDVLDVHLGIKALVEGIGADLTRADLDDDGRFTVRDLLLVLRTAAGLVPARRLPDVPQGVMLRRFRPGDSWDYTGKGTVTTSLVSLPIGCDLQVRVLAWPERSPTGDPVLALVVTDSTSLMGLTSRNSGGMLFGQDAGGDVWVYGQAQEVDFTYEGVYVLAGVPSRFDAYWFASGMREKALPGRLANGAARLIRLCYGVYDPQQCGNAGLSVGSVERLTLPSGPVEAVRVEARSNWIGEPEGLLEATFWVDVRVGSIVRAEGRKKLWVSGLTGSVHIVWDLVSEVLSTTPAPVVPSG